MELCYFVRISFSIFCVANVSHENVSKNERLVPGPRFLSVPRVRLSISRAKSGTNPETPRKRSQSKFWISRFRTVWDPKTLENKGDSLPKLISELCYPQYGLYPFIFWRAPFMEQPELVMKFLTLLGAPLSCHRQFFVGPFWGVIWGQMCAKLQKNRPLSPGPAEDARNALKSGPGVYLQTWTPNWLARASMCVSPVRCILDMDLEFTLSPPVSVKSVDL